MILVLGVALVAALVARQSTSRSDLKTYGLIAGLALGLRVVTTGIIYLITSPVHREGVWLNDEASYFLATEALMPWPWDKSLPLGLDHLGGNGYLGLTAAISMAGNMVNAEAFRMTNATFGTLVVLLCAFLANTFFGRTAGIAAGLVAGVWPDLVLWSATMLRDTLGSLAVVGVWWTLVMTTRRRWLLTLCFVVLAVVLLSTVRMYLAGAVGLGAAAWLVYPFLRRQPARTLALATLGLIVVGSVLAVLQARRLDEIEHELIYKQTVTRMETLGRLYIDPPAVQLPFQLPFLPGSAIALTDPQTGWLSTGLVDNSAETGFVDVVLTDDTVRRVPIGHVLLLQDARIPPLELLTWVTPSVMAVFVGLPATNEAPNLGWIGAALAWDVLLLAGMVGLVRSRLAFRDWLFPLCVIGGTIAALTAIPGSPGNAERHRATQTVPLLLVLAAGALTVRASSPAGLKLTNTRSMPPSATTAVASSRRSAR